MLTLCADSMNLGFVVLAMGRKRLRPKSSLNRTQHGMPRLGLI